MAALCVVCTSFAAHAQNIAPSVDLDELAPFVSRIHDGRGTILLHSDSRTIYAGHGIQHGIELAFAQPGRPGIFGTPAFSPGRNNGSGDGLGYTWQNNGSASANAQLDTGCAQTPSPLSDYCDPYDAPLTVMDDTTVGTGRLGIIADAGSWLPLHQEVRLDVWHGVSPGGTVITPRRRLDVPPYTAEPSLKKINTTRSAVGIRRTNVSWTSQQPSWANESQAVMLHDPNAALPSGLCVHLLQVTRPMKTNGVCVATRHRGGNSALDNYNEIFPAASDPSWTDDGRRFYLDAATMHADGWLLV
ncbi:MAG: hypothetical protein AAF432_12140, partial [Planctomycetota bacterium]